jgi:hydrogenase/urease accessory protein HupE
MLLLHAFHLPFVERHIAASVSAERFSLAAILSATASRAAAKRPRR